MSADWWQAQQQLEHEQWLADEAARLEYESWLTELNMQFNEQETAHG